MSDEEVNSVPDPPFELGNYHKKALVTLLHLYHGNRQTLTYEELSLRLDVGKKTKAWQSGAWKDLKGHEYIVPSTADTKKYELSEKGVQIASTLVSAEELAEFAPPDTNSKLHEKIKARVARDDKARKYGGKLLDVMSAPDYVPLNRHELASKFDIVADSHGFCYALKWHKDNGYVEFCTAEEIAALKAKNEMMAQDEGASTGEEKQKADSMGDDHIEEETKEPKKKKYKSTKKRSGGKPLKLSKKAFVHPP